MSDDKKITAGELEQAAGAGPGFLQTDGTYGKTEVDLRKAELKKISAGGPGFVQSDGTYGKTEVEIRKMKRR